MKAVQFRMRRLAAAGQTDYQVSGGLPGADMLPDMSVTAAIQQSETFMSTASNGGRHPDTHRVCAVASRDPELDQYVRRQISCAELNKDAAKACVPDIAGDCLPTRILYVDIPAD
jgi:hypothetical protein